MTQSEKREFRSMLNKAYEKSNPSFRAVTGFYADHSVREVSSYRLGNYCGYSVRVRTKERGTISMFFGEFSSWDITEWISLMMEHYNVTGVSIDAAKSYKMHSGEHYGEYFNTEDALERFTQFNGDFGHWGWGGVGVEVFCL